MTPAEETLRILQSGPRGVRSLSTAAECSHEGTYQQSLALLQELGLAAGLKSKLRSQHPRDYLERSLLAVLNPPRCCATQQHQGHCDAAGSPAGS